MEQELKWIRRIQRRRSERDAELLIRKYYDEIYVYVYRQTGKKEDALDLTQEIFISVLRSIGTFQPKKASFRTWVYRIATNKIIDERRKYRPAYLNIEDVELPEEMDFIKREDDRRLLNKIDVYVSALDGETGQIFRLRVYQGMSFVEIGQVLNIPEATVKTRFHRLKNKLRKEFEDEYQDT